MTQYIETVRELWAARNDEEGQGLAECGLILALCSILAVAALGVLGNAIIGVLEKVSAAL